MAGEQRQQLDVTLDNIFDSQKYCLAERLRSLAESCGRQTTPATRATSPPAEFDTGGQRQHLEHQAVYLFDARRPQ